MCRKWRRKKIPYKKPRQSRRCEIYVRCRRARPHTKSRGKLATVRFMLTAGENVLRQVVRVRTKLAAASLILAAGATKYKWISREAKFISSPFLCNFSRFSLYPLKIFTSNLPKTFIPPSLSSLYLKTLIFYSNMFNLERFWASISIFVRI